MMLKKVHRNVHRVTYTELNRKHLIQILLPTWTCYTCSDININTNIMIYGVKKEDPGEKEVTHLLCNLGNGGEQLTCILLLLFRQIARVFILIFIVISSFIEGF